MALAPRIVFVLLAPAVCSAAGPSGRGLLFFASYPERANTAAIANPYVSGALHTFYWSNVEPAEGRYDWEDVDRRIRPWVEAGKQVALRIMWSSAGSWPEPAAKRPFPQWLTARGAAAVNTPVSGAAVPLVWDPLYKVHARRLLREMARKFDGHPAIAFIDVTPGAETNPYRARMDRYEAGFREVFKNTPASDGRGYSEQLWAETVKWYIDEAAAAFRSTKLLVTLNVGSLDGPSRFREFGEHAVSKGMFVGQNGLNRNSYQSGSERKNLFAEWDNRTQLYFEMNAALGGTTGSLMEVMKAAERIDCDYLGVYAVDVLKGTRGQPRFDAAFEEALKYGAEAIGKR